MEPGEHLYIIGLGDQEDWQAGRGRLCYFEDEDDKVALPVFTTSEKAKGYARDHLGAPEAHMDMLESLGATAESDARPLTEGRIAIIKVDSQGLQRAAASVRPNYLVRDFRPGEDEEVLWLDR